MHKEEKLNINEEFEKLVPSVKREMLFDESENYESLRNYIINQPREVYSKKKLPFSEVVLLSYPYYKKYEVIDLVKAKGKRIFFIKQSIKGKPDFCDAAGYYDYTTKKFVLLSYSYIVNKLRDLFKKNDTKTVALDGVNLYTISIKVFDSPEEAASYVLGQRAGLNEWVDIKGKGLDTYYKRFAEPEFARQESNEAQTVPNYLPPKITTNKELYNDLYVINKSEDNNQLVNNDTSIFFYIQIDIGTGTMYKAFGYYDVRARSFILKAGSCLLEKVSSSYKYTADEMKRRMLIKKYCTKESGFFRINRDCNFMTPSQAASCVLGCVVDGWKEWKDKTGKSLGEFYS